MQGFVYILKDSTGKFYVGSTNDIKRRLQQHNNKHTQTTYKMQSPKLALVQKYDSLEFARKIERQIKRLKRKEYIEKMIKDGHIKMKIKNLRP